MVPSKAEERNLQKLLERKEPIIVTESDDNVTTTHHDNTIENGNGINGTHENGVNGIATDGTPNGCVNADPTNQTQNGQSIDTTTTTPKDDEKHV